MADRKELRAFLVESGCLDVDGMMKSFEPFFRIIGRSDINCFPESAFPLAGQDIFDPEEVKKVFGSLTGDNVEKVIFVSIDNLLAKPEWMMDKVFVKSFTSSMASCFWDSVEIFFLDKISLDHPPPITKNFFYLAWLFDYQLWNSLETDIENLMESYREHFMESFLRSLISYLITSIHSCFFSFLYFSLENRKKEVEKLKPLMALISKGVLPIGMQAGNPKIWLVLVA